MQNSNSQSDINTKPEMSVQWISHRQPRPLILYLRSRRVYVQFQHIWDNILLILLEFQVFFQSQTVVSTNTAPFLLHQKIKISKLHHALRKWWTIANTIKLNFHPSAPQAQKFCPSCSSRWSYELDKSVLFHSSFFISSFESFQLPFLFNT
jgi:hypothetical protein